MNDERKISKLVLGSPFYCYCLERRLSDEWIVLSLSFMLRPTVSRLVCLGKKHQSGAFDHIFITVRQLRVCWCASGIYNCCWPSPAQLFSGPSPVGLLTIFYTPRFETSLFVASYVWRGYGGGIRPLLCTAPCTLQLVSMEMSLAWLLSRKTCLPHRWLAMNYSVSFLCSGNVLT
jgi:hypothetical protein